MNTSSHIYFHKHVFFCWVSLGNPIGVVVKSIDPGKKQRL